MVGKLRDNVRQLYRVPGQQADTSASWSTTGVMPFQDDEMRLRRGTATARDYYFSPTSLQTSWQK